MHDCEAKKVITGRRYVTQMDFVNYASLFCHTIIVLWFPEFNRTFRNFAGTPGV